MELLIIDWKQKLESNRRNLSKESKEFEKAGRAIDKKIIPKQKGYPS